MATGTAPMFYQWQLNGVNLVGANQPTLEFKAQPSNAGDYRVVLSNAGGHVTSAVARLTVNPGNGVRERFLNLTRAVCRLLSAIPQARTHSGCRALYRVLGTGNWCIQNRKSFPAPVSSHHIY